MRFKLVEDFTDKVKQENERSNSEQYFKKEIEHFRSNPYLNGQPIYLVCPQFTYEIKIPADKVEELLNEGTLKIKEIYETSDFGIATPRKEALPKIEEDYNPISKSSPIVLDIKKPQDTDYNKLVIHLPNSTNKGIDLLSTDTDGRLCEALYLLDGVNAYRAEVPIYTVEKWVQDGLATPFPNNNSEMMFQKLKRTFQEYCQEKELPYTSWINE